METSLRVGLLGVHRNDQIGPQSQRQRGKRPTQCQRRAPDIDGILLAALIDKDLAYDLRAPCK